MYRTSNLKRNVVTQRRTSDACMEVIRQSYEEGRGRIYVSVEKLKDAFNDYTVASLQSAIEDARDGIDLLQSFIHLAEAEKKRVDTAKKVS